MSRNRDGGWRVRIVGPDGEETREYAAVLVANGHHWDARWPEPAYPGDFEGEQIHAHDYRSKTELAGRDVVVVGMGNSALDISVEAAQGRPQRHHLGAPRPVGAPEVPARQGRRPGRLPGPDAVVGDPGPGWSSALKVTGNLTRVGIPHPDHRPGQSPSGAVGRVQRSASRPARSPRNRGIDHLEGRSVVFTDGTSAPVDLIVWATGYRVTFPFLDPALIAAQDNDLPLWKRMVHPDLPGLYFIGLVQAVGAVMPTREAQGVWVAQILTGQYLPPPERGDPRPDAA